MGLMDSFRIRAALSKHQKGDIQGAKQEYEALISQGIMKPNFLLPYSVLLLDEVSAAASDENALRLTECLAATGQQVFLITHREADAVAAQDVIALS